jgi:hypothetical protein
MKTSSGILIAAACVGAFHLLTNLEGNSARTEQAPAAMSVEELKSQALSIPYAWLAREPKNYAGKLVTFRGKVVQALESGSYVTLRIDVTPKGSWWSNTVWVDYRKGSSSEPRILEKDIVNFWGEYVGIKSYETVLHSTIQIPQVAAKVVEIEEQPAAPNT